MKKILYAIAFIGIVALTACSKEEPGGTATQDAAGQWYVTVDAVDANGNVVFTDDELFGIGEFISLTFNTTANVPDKMYVSDNGNFWDYQVEVNVDLNTLTFATDGWAPNLAYDCKVKIHGGQIIKGGATTPSGMPADAVVYYVNFDDDDYPEAYGYDCYRVSGYRYTGFVADE